MYGFIAQKQKLNFCEHSLALRKYTDAKWHKIESLTK